MQGCSKLLVDCGTGDVHVVLMADLEWREHLALTGSWQDRQSLQEAVIQKHLTALRAYLAANPDAAHIAALAMLLGIR